MSFLWKSAADPWFLVLENWEKSRKRPGYFLGWWCTNPAVVLELAFSFICPVLRHGSTWTVCGSSFCYFFFCVCLLGELSLHLLMALWRNLQHPFPHVPSLLRRNQDKKHQLPSWKIRVLFRKRLLKVFPRKIHLLLSPAVTSMKHKQTRWGCASDRRLKSKI